MILDFPNHSRELSYFQNILRMGVPLFVPEMLFDDERRRFEAHAKNAYTRKSISKFQRLTAIFDHF